MLRKPREYKDVYRSKNESLGRVFLFSTASRPFMSVLSLIRASSE